MRHLFSVFILALLFSSLAGAQGVSNINGCPVPNLPNSFKVEEKLFSLMTSLRVTSDTLNMGSVTKKFLSWTRSFYWKDPNGVQLATAREELLTWGTVIDVYDCNNNKIGTLKEEILKSLFKVQTFYSILDPYGRKIAESEKVDWISTDFTLRDSSGQVVATLHRPWISWPTDRWTVHIQKPGVVDPRIIVMIGAYKTDVDNQRRNDENNSNDDDDDNKN